MKKTTPTLYSILCAALAARAAVPRHWKADVAEAGTYQTSFYRGETIDISAQLTLGGRPFAVPAGASASMCVSTNDLRDAWVWPATVTTGGLIRATWLPEYDPGASAVRGFLRVDVAGTNVNYHANFLFRLLGSPGAVPNELSMPVRVLDFSQIAVTNPPWQTYTAGDNITISNGVISASGGGGGTLTEETDPVFRGWAETNDLPTRAEIESGYTEWVCDPAEITITVRGVPSPFNPDPGPGRDETVSFCVVRGSEGDGHADYWEMRGSSYCYGIPILYDPDGTATHFSAEMTLRSWGAGISPASVAVTATRRLITPTKTSQLENDSDFVTRSWVLASYGGTNIWISIDGDLLGIYACTNAASGTNTLWESSAAMGGQLSDVALRATNNTVRITAIEARPDLTSWGDYAPDGTSNPDAEAVLYLNKALTLMGSGFSWATAGAYACLCQSGAVAFHAETNGEVRIGLDVVSNYFGMVQGGSVTVGCMTHGIRVEGSGDNTIVHLLYAYAGGEFPVIWGMTSLAGDKTELSPVWTDYGDGTAEAAVPGHPFYFFMATSSRSLEARFESKAPAAFPGGIYGGFSSPPVKYDTVITIQQSGHTYRIPAELVQ